MNELEDRLSSLLARSGAAVEVHPDVDRVLDAAGGTPGAAGKRRPRLVLAAALVVVVGLAGAALALRESQGDDRDPGRTDPAADDADVTTVGDPPDGWLVPTWLPEGQQFWTVDQRLSPGPRPTLLPQLFGDPAEGRAIFVSAGLYEVRGDAGRDVTVRGLPGRAGPTWDVEEDDKGEGIAWDERGLTITARYQGMNAEEAIAALDALEWRSDDPADGFAPPDDDGNSSSDALPLRAETSRVPTLGRDAMLVTSEGPPERGGTATGRPGFEIFTSTASNVSGRYLEAWYEQGPTAADGTRPLTSVDPDGTRLSVVWPDGRSIDIDSQLRLEEPEQRDVVQRIADSVTAFSETEMAELRATAEAATAGLPVVASAATRIGTIEVHGDGSFLRLCRRDADQLRQSGQGPECPVSGLGTGPAADGNTAVTGGWVVDGVWYAVMASTGELPQILGAHDPSQNPNPDELPTEETATDGEWTFRLVQPPADVISVCIGREGSTACTDHRPA